MFTNLTIFNGLSPITRNWADMMDDDLILPKNKKIIKKKNKTVDPDGNTTEVVEYDDITYFYDKYNILQQKTTKKIDIKKTKKLHKSVADRKENRLLFGDANDPKNDTITQKLGHVDFEDPNKEVDDNEVINKVTSGFSKVLQNLAKRKLNVTVNEPESIKEIPKNTYVPPHLRNKEVVVDEEKEEVSTGVKVDNFPLGTTVEDLELLFSNCGKIKFKNGVWIHPTGNFAFVNFNTHEEAIKAIEMINGHIYGNLYLNVELSKPRKKMESNKKSGYGERLAQQGRYSYVTNSNKKY